jgi:hypothetical protein
MSKLEGQLASVTDHEVQSTFLSFLSVECFRGSVLREGFRLGFWKGKAVECSRKVGFEILRSGGRVY